MLIARVLDGSGQNYDRKKIADEAKNGNNGQEDTFNYVIKPTKTHVLDYLESTFERWLSLNLALNDGT